MMNRTHDPTALEVRHLRLVRAIAAEASVTRAARRLHLSQSAVSHQLVDLERELGTRLFDRVGKRMVLTAAGTKAVEAAERVLSELATLERDLRRQRRDARQTLRVTTSCYTSYHWLPAALEHFAESHPRLDIAIVFEATRRAAEALLADEVDLAILVGQGGAALAGEKPLRNDALATLPITESELVVVASPEHAVLTRGKGAPTVRYADLRGATVLVHDGAPEPLLARLREAVRVSWEKTSGERLAEPIAIRGVPLTEALVSLARSGVGVAVVDRWLVEGYLDRSVVAKPLHPRAARSFHAVFRKSNPRELPIEALVRVIAREAAARLGASARTRRGARA